MKRSHRANAWMSALVLVVFLALLALLVTLREWIADVFVVRAAYALWLLRLFIRSRPQSMYWTLPVVVGIGIGVMVFVGHLGKDSTTASSVVILGRAADWSEWLILAEKQPFFRKFLQRKLESLVRAALESKHEELSLFERDLPPEVIAVVSPRARFMHVGYSSQQLGDVEDSGSWEPEVVVEYLEGILEVVDDR